MLEGVEQLEALEALEAHRHAAGGAPQQQAYGPPDMEGFGCYSRVSLVRFSLTDSPAQPKMLYKHPAKS